MSSLVVPSNKTNNKKRTRALFGDSSAFLPREDVALREAALTRRLHLQFHQANIPTAAATTADATTQNKNETSIVVVDDPKEQERQNDREGDGVTTTISTTTTASGVLARLEAQEETKKRQQESGILVRRQDNENASNIPTPQWHAPWKLSTVLSSHLGWVRSIAVDPTNNALFATGGADRVIKIWNLAKASVGANDALQWTLTGHISPVRGLAFSPRHPYLFSCGEDKQIKCWDLETNQVVRHYHGHLSGVFVLKLHPTLDVLVTGGRDAVARVWDMRTKTQIHVLEGHEHTVASILTKATDPQIITGSHDTTIKLWDLVAGKCQSTLTHHSKSIRAMVQPSFRNTFLSGAADCIKHWQGKDGRFIKSWMGHGHSVLNAMAVNDDGVVVSGGDDGSLKFWDYHSNGYSFQSAQSIPQPGSLVEAENAIFAMDFDLTGTRLITCEADKTIKIYKPDDDASELSHPIDMQGWRKQWLKELKQRY